MEKKFECHEHIFMNGRDYREAAVLYKNGPVEEDIRAHLAAYRDLGITYCRDGGDPFGASLLAARLAPEYGLQVATPAFAIHRRGYYGGIVGLGYSDLGEYRELVARARVQGAGFIKLMYSGILDCRVPGALSCPSLPPAEIRELVAVAHGEGLPVMAHVNGADAVRAALEAGTDSIEHGYYMDGECLALLAETGAIWVPTLAAIHGFLHRPGFPEEAVEEILAGQAINLRRAAELGAHIASGSDAGAVGVPHGEGLLTELSLLKAALGPENPAIITEGNRLLSVRFPPAAGL